MRFARDIARLLFRMLLPLEVSNSHSNPVDETTAYKQTDCGGLTPYAMAGGRADVKSVRRISFQLFYKGGAAEQ